MLQKKAKTIFVLFLMSAMGFMIQSSFGAAILPTDLYENNDTIDTASTISIGNYADLTLDTAYSDQDYYNITLIGGNLYEFIFWNSSGMIVIEIMNSTSNLVDSVILLSSYVEKSCIIVENTEEHTIYVSGAETYYSMNISKISDDNYEDNDDFGSAKNLSLNTKYSNQLFDDDYFQIDLLATETLQINFTVTDFFSSDVCIFSYIYLYDPLQQQIELGWPPLTWVNDSQYIIYFNNDKISGTYYVLIDFDEIFIEYDLEITHVSDDSFENNDLRLSAAPLNSDMIQESIEAICMDDDWYSQSVTNTSQLMYVVLYTCEPLSSLTLNIVDSNGFVVSEFTNISAIIDQENCFYYIANYTVTQSGTYYYQVSSSTEKFEYILLFSEFYTTKPTDLTISEGTTGNGIEWTFYDNSGMAYDEGGTIEIYRDGFLITSRVYNLYSNPEGQTQIISLDGIPQGTYTYEIRVITNLISQETSDTVIVTIGEGDLITVNSPADVGFQFGTPGVSIGWTPTTIGSIAIRNYTIYKNDTVLETGNWVSGTIISISVEGLETGYYNYTIVLNGDDLSIQDTVIVEVIQTPVETPSGSGIPGFNTSIILFSIIFSIAIISISIRKHKFRIFPKTI